MHSKKEHVDVDPIPKKIISPINKGQLSIFFSIDRMQNKVRHSMLILIGLKMTSAKIQGCCMIIFIILSSLSLGSQYQTDQALFCRYVQYDSVCRSD